MLLLLLILVGLLVIGVVVIYNNLVRLRVRAESSWSDIDVQLKRRHDLIPNLVETVRGYAGHERETLESVVQARTRAVAARSPGESSRAEGELTRTLQALFALAENYPQLRASENFGQLQSSLAMIEEAIQNARRYYNAVVRDLNTKIHQFPSNLVAQSFGFQEREFFELDSDAERAAPRVQFSSSPDV